MGNLNGKKALVTGGSRGIGAAVVRRLVADGAAVAVNYRSDAERAKELVRELDSDTTRVVAIHADVSDPGGLRELAATAVEELGGLDIAVSNAGIEHFGALADITADDFARVFDTNVRGQLFVAQAAAAHLPPGGRIVLTSSASTRISVRHHALYAASKAAAHRARTPRPTARDRRRRGLPRLTRRLLHHRIHARRRRRRLTRRARRARWTRRNRLASTGLRARRCSPGRPGSRARRARPWSARPDRRWRT